MSDTRYLIVNADDFGQSSSVNRGIMEAHFEGIVTSTSMMTRWSAATEAAALAHSAPRLDVGLHLDLGEWHLVDGDWGTVYHVVRLDDAEAVKAEVIRQLDAFRQLLDREPTHLDSHQHVHLREPARTVIEGLAKSQGLPLRSVTSPARYVGDFYGQNEDASENLQAISVSALVDTLKELRPGVSELACHPGRNVDFDTMYRTERDVEVDTLCNPEVRAALADLDITLCTYASIPGIERDLIAKQ